MRILFCVTTPSYFLSISEKWWGVGGGGGLQWAEGKERKEEGAAAGGEGPVSFISSATVHEPCWLRYYFNSPSHLPYYLLIYAHHYGGCSLCDE